MSSQKRIVAIVTYVGLALLAIFAIYLIWHLGVFFYHEVPYAFESHFGAH